MKFLVVLLCLGIACAAKWERKEPRSRPFNFLRFMKKEAAEGRQPTEEMLRNFGWPTEENQSEDTEVEDSDEEEESDVIDNSSKSRATDRGPVEEVVENTEEEEEEGLIPDDEEEDVGVEEDDHIPTPDPSEWQEREGGPIKGEHRSRPPFGRRHHRGRHHRRADSPKYRTIKKYRGYELRCYPPYLWATTKDDNLDGKCFGSMFKRLFKYIRGHNSKNRTIPMTKPVAVSMDYNITDHKTKMKMRFFISRRSMRCNRCGPPKPLDPKVTINRSPFFCAFVRKFNKWVMSRSWYYYKHLWYLTKDLYRDGKSDYYHKGFSIFAGYDSPWKLWNRHNEVMRVVKCPRCNGEKDIMSTVNAMVSETPIVLPEDGFAAK